MHHLGAVLFCSVALGSPPALPNLDFRQGNFTGWEGQGFYVTTANPRGAGLAVGACSSDARSTGRIGMLRYVFQVPEGAGRIRFRAYAAQGPGCDPKQLLDVLLLGQGKRVVPRKVRGASGWVSAPALLPREGRAAREYCWDVSDLVGQTLQIVLVDQDDRPGCHVFCGGFRLEPADDGERREFSAFMLALERKKSLPPLATYESRHFLAWSNADDVFTAVRLRNGEQIYESFFDHFRARGFTVRPPSRKLMVAVFDSQEGFEAYLGRKMPSTLLGVYHHATNRFVIYDLHRNRGLAAGRDKLLQAGRDIPIDLDRLQYTGAVEREVRELGEDLNVSTTMHEVAHQLSFNCGLLNRGGDVPVWLAEGLACYCEATQRGSWQGLGAVSPERIRGLKVQIEKGGKLLPLKTLLSDGWLREPRTAGLGYAQSWALFRMLMEERPAALKNYLSLIHPRRTDDHRLPDFGQAFGADLAGLERRHIEYIRELLRH